MEQKKGTGQKIHRKPLNPQAVPRYVSQSLHCPALHIPASIKDLAGCIGWKQTVNPNQGPHHLSKRSKKTLTRLRSSTWWHEAHTKQFSSRNQNRIRMQVVLHKFCSFCIKFCNRSLGKQKKHIQLYTWICSHSSHTFAGQVWRRHTTSKKLRTTSKKLRTVASSRGRDFLASTQRLKSKHPNRIAWHQNIPDWEMQPWLLSFCIIRSMRLGKWYVSGSLCQHISTIR